MDIIDPRLGQSARSGDLEKPGRRDSGSARTSITRSTPAAWSASELGHGRRLHSRS
jgi:hypothetical protein